MIPAAYGYATASRPDMPECRALANLDLSELPILEAPASWAALRRDHGREPLLTRARLLEAEADVVRAIAAREAREAEAARVDLARRILDRDADPRDRFYAAARGEARR